MSKQYFGVDRLKNEHYKNFVEYLTRFNVFIHEVMINLKKEIIINNSVQQLYVKCNVTNQQFIAPKSFA